MTRLTSVLFFLCALGMAAPAAAQPVTTPAKPAASAHPAVANPKGTPAPPKPAKPTPTPSPSPTPGPPWSNMHWREIGPALPGGRVPAVAGSATDPNLYYLGSAGGGVWKSQDGGETWQAVFADKPVSAIGAVAIDPSNNDNVWVGTGEANPRNDVSYGDGVYKSTDGGKTFEHVGLSGTRHISRILIDPKDSKHVIVGALGNVFGPSTDRGVYVTWDGGKTWTKTLYVSDQSGASDLAMSSDGSEIYAGIWHFQRVPWTFTSGGPDDGLYKSTDGGKTWTHLTGHGLPGGITGRIGLAVAPSDAKRVYALIEAAHGILWRSDDAGATWTMVSDNTLVDQRPFYFTHVAVDPKNPDKVYAVSMMLSVSTDGGKKFKSIAKQVHVDFHAIWIAPNDPKRIIVGEDGGIARTVDGGEHWFFGRNVPIGEVYHIGYSVNENPYWVCGGWQDNSAWCGPSNSLDPSGLLNKYWVQSSGGDGEWSIPDPLDPNWLWADSENGSLTVYNKKTGDTIFAEPYLAQSLASFNLSLAKYRFNWDSPIAFAPWNGHVAWYGANVVFQTTDRGIHWTVISPDLTLNDKAHQQPSGGPITHDVSGAEYSDTIIDIEGSTLHKGEIWVGTDDGLVQLTRDGGKHWARVTPPGVPPYGRVETVAPSTINDGTAYVNIDRHRSDDFRPYLFVTHDFGRHWTSLSATLPQDQYVRSVRQDLHNPRIVYAGTENGIWISFDGGANWHDFKDGLPTVSVRDIRIQPQWDDLMIATHGRALYIMDDIRMLQHLQGTYAQRDFLIAPRTAYEYSLHSDDEGIYTDFAGDNPPYGATVWFFQQHPMKGAPEIQILDARGNVVRTVKGTHKVGKKEEPYIDNKTGINAYTWDFGSNGPVKWHGAAKPEYQGPNEGPGVPPGRYMVRMRLGGRTYTKPFTVKPDPRSTFTQAEYLATYAFGRKFTREYSNVDVMLNSLDSVKKQLTAAQASPKIKADTALESQISAALTERERLFNRLTANYQNDEDSIERPGALREDMGGLGFFGAGVITPAVRNYGNRVNAEYVSVTDAYNRYISTLTPIDNALRAAGLKPPSVTRISK
jgi:photosystem II stability/assembly factor-like uncharacterized protein